MIYDDQTSSAMNYYEELGIGPDATEQEIRKAHRRLVKLMHPDAQPDHNLKMLAETQMRRLNSIVSTLLDPEQRRSYDEELQSASHAHQRQSILPGWRGIPWWLASTAGAVVLTLVAVWLWADHLGNSFGSKTRTVYSQSPERSTVSEMPSAEQQQRRQEQETRNEIGSASYKAPAAPPLPAANDGVSTAVVPDLPPDAKESAKTKQVPPVVEKPASVADNRAPSLPPKQSVQPEIKKAMAPPPKPVESKPVMEHKADSRQVPAPQVVKQAPVLVAKTVVPEAAVPAPAPKKIFNLPGGSVIASTKQPNKTGQLPPPPSVGNSNVHDYSSTLPPASLPAAIPPKLAVVTTAANAGGSLINPRDPLEGEWVYAPKEPEKRKAGFYPPEFIDLKLFGAGDPGNLKGQYSAKYLVTDRPVSPEVTFELASVSRGSRKFVWQSSNGAKGTLNIDPIDERTIRIDWRTTSAVSGPALTSGTATLVRRQ
jgi:curved DNA-binding protein CbpA